MNAKERVIVVEDPVKWDTLVRKAGMEPNHARERDAMPYYIERENPDYTLEECREIERASDNRPGTLLVRQNKVETFEYLSISNVARRDIASLLRVEELVVTTLLQNFLISLGGTNIRIIQKVSKSEKEKSEWINRAKVDIGAYKGDIAATVAKDRRCDTEIGGGTEIKKADPNWEQALHYLEMNSFLKEYLSAVFSSVKNGSLHGTFSTHFDLKIRDVCTRKYDDAVDVAGKYNLIPMSLRNDFKKKVTEEKSITISWVYSAEF